MEDNEFIRILRMDVLKDLLYCFQVQEFLLKKTSKMEVLSVYM